MSTYNLSVISWSSLIACSAVSFSSTTMYFGGSHSGRSLMSLSVSLTKCGNMSPPFGLIHAAGWIVGTTCTPGTSVEGLAEPIRSELCHALYPTRLELLCSLVRELGQHLPSHWRDAC